MRYSRPHAVLVVLVALVVVPLFALAQSRSDAFDAADISITELVARPLPDGGCAARWCGTVTSSDGGAQLTGCTDEVELKASANLTRCNALFNAGANRVGRALRFDLDAGSP